MPSIMNTNNPAGAEVGTEMPSEGMEYTKKPEENDDILSSYGDEDIIMSVMSRPDLKMKLMELLKSETPEVSPPMDPVAGNPGPDAGAY